MRRGFWLVLVAMICLSAGWAAGEGAAPRIPLAKEQLIAFLGDSITQQNLYTRYVELLLNARYPALRLRFVNVGWSGRHAAHLMDDRVLERDLLRLKPDVVLIMFGMNDGWYRAPADPAAIAAYHQNMAELVKKITAALPGVRIVLLTPTICEPARSSYYRAYNDTLASMGAFVKELGAQSNLPVIDLFTPMLEADTAAKQLDPKFTMLLDGVHPNPAGHWLIATVIGKAFGIDPPVDVRVDLDATNSAVTAQTGVAVRDLHVTTEGIRFKQTTPRVPVALPLEARGAAGFPSVQAAADHAVLAIHGLLPEQPYGVYCDGRLVGRYPGSELDKGIDWLTYRYEYPMTQRVLQLAMAKFRYRWTAWRAPDTGLAAADAADFMEKGWEALDGALSRMTRHADDEEYKTIEEAKTHDWRISPEEPVMLPKFEITGPLNNQGFDVAYPPETGKTPVQPWINATPDDRGFLDFLPDYGAYRNSVLFARIALQVPRETWLSLSAGSFGSLKVWVNGELCIAEEVDIDALRIAEDGQNTGIAHLKPGVNTILVRETRGSKGWGFFLHAYLAGLTQEELQAVKTLPE